MSVSRVRENRAHGSKGGGRRPGAAGRQGPKGRRASCPPDKAERSLSSREGHFKRGQDQVTNCPVDQGQPVLGRGAGAAEAARGIGRLYLNPGTPNVGTQPALDSESRKAL